MMPPTPDREPGRLIDPATEQWLAEDGLPGFTLAEVVDSEGVASFWIVDRDQLGIGGTDHGNEDPPHELDGPLPARWQRDLDGRPSYCGALTATGYSCRIRVAGTGQRCRHHEHSSAKESR